MTLKIFINNIPCEQFAKYVCEVLELSRNFFCNLPHALWKYGTVICVLTSLQFTLQATILYILAITYSYTHIEPDVLNKLKSLHQGLRKCIIKQILLTLS